MVATPIVLGEQRVVLQNVSWQFYEATLQELGQNRAVRLAYDTGMLEVMSPLMPHERSKRLIEKLVDALLEELEIPAVSVGSMTCKRFDLAKGAEPDTAYYIQNEALIRGRESVDLNQDPPPDLVLEVEYSRSTLDKLGLYAALGVTEVWRFDGTELRLYRLAGEQYQNCSTSPAFPKIAVTQLPQFLQVAREINEIAMIKQFRVWIRQQASL